MTLERAMFIWGSLILVVMNVIVGIATLPTYWYVYVLMTMLEISVVILMIAMFE